MTFSYSTGALAMLILMIRISRGLTFNKLENWQLRSAGDPPHRRITREGSSRQALQTDSF
jgi:hypothetical protein